MNIILIGFMGTGKSVVGRLLAHELKLDFLDLDSLIERTEKKSVSQIFKENGEGQFRDLESRVVKTLQDYDKFVIATGGGVVLRPENIAALKAAGKLVLLWAEPEQIFERTAKEKQRPLLNVADPMSEIKKILAGREALYRQAADLTVDTTGLKVEDVVREIIAWLK